MVHETFTAIGCLGDVLTGNTKRSRERWKKYAEESVVGSRIYAGIYLSYMGSKKKKNIERQFVTKVSRIRERHCIRVF